MAEEEKHEVCDSMLQVLTDELQRLLKKWQNDVSLQQTGNRFVMSISECCRCL